MDSSRLIDLVESKKDKLEYVHKEANGVRRLTIKDGSDGSFSIGFSSVNNFIVIVSNAPQNPLIAGLYAFVCHELTSKTPEYSVILRPEVDNSSSKKARLNEIVGGLEWLGFDKEQIGSFAERVGAAFPPAIKAARAR